ncbi:hypothetical protein O3P69_009919 [Scylla paramamosain]|uniref:Uncharacterized protein n=1 Tax=Scylla paramamosain TaxID=85552 RepID=A0AAW0SMQ4_SCYPA
MLPCSQTAHEQVTGALIRKTQSLPVHRAVSRTFSRHDLWVPAKTNHKTDVIAAPRLTLSLLSHGGEEGEGRTKESSTRLA